MKTLMAIAALLAAVEHDWYIAREFEPLMQEQQLEAERVGTTIVCAAGIPRSRAIRPFDKMARPDSATSYPKSHDDPLQRRNLVCLD